MEAYGVGGALNDLKMVFISYSHCSQHSVSVAYHIFGCRFDDDVKAER